MTFGTDGVWKIASTVGNVEKGFKNSGGGWKVMGRNTVEVCMWNESHVNGTFKVYRIFDENIISPDEIVNDC